MLPKTTEGYRTWVYLGLVMAPSPSSSDEARLIGQTRLLSGPLGARRSLRAADEVTNYIVAPTLLAAAK